MTHGGNVFNADPPSCPHAFLLHETLFPPRPDPIRGPALFSLTVFPIGTVFSSWLDTPSSSKKSALFTSLTFKNLLHCAFYPPLLHSLSSMILLDAFNAKHPSITSPLVCLLTLHSCYSANSYDGCDSLTILFMALFPLIILVVPLSLTLDEPFDASPPVCHCFSW